MCFKMAVILKQLMEYFSKTPWIKAETLNFNHILIAWLKIHCDGVQRQNLKKNNLIVQIFMDRPLP